MSRFWSPKKRSKALTLHEEGYSLRDIAAKLGGKATFSGVRKLVLKYNNTGKLDDKKRCGRKRKTSDRDDRLLKRLSLSNRRLSSAKLCHAWGKRVSSSLVRRRLVQCGLKARRPRRKPLLTLCMRKKRMDWARQHLHWSYDDWMNVLFSDETKINIHGTDGIQFVRRRVGEALNPSCTIPSVKFPASIMVWGCMSGRGIGRLHVIDGTLTAARYITEILEKKLMSSAKNLFPVDVTGTVQFTYQQDNAPSHTAKKVKEWFQTHGVQVLDWPGNSPDLNPIENLWRRLKVLVAEHKAGNKQQLLEAVIASWYRVISVQELQRLVHSMPDRCRAVLKARGYATKY